MIRDPFGESQRFENSFIMMLRPPIYLLLAGLTHHLSLEIKYTFFGQTAFNYQGNSCWIVILILIVIITVAVVVTVTEKVTVIKIMVKVIRAVVRITSIRCVINHQGSATTSPWCSLSHAERSSQNCPRTGINIDKILFRGMGLPWAQ